MGLPNSTSTIPGTAVSSYLNLCHHQASAVYHTFAKALDAMGQNEFADEKGVKHNWRQELIAELAKRQRTDGSWANSEKQWMEGDANLATGFALLTLSYCKPAK